MASTPSRTRRVLFLSVALASTGLLPGQAIPADKDVQTLPGGIRYSILKEGTGTVRPADKDTVKVHFHEWLSDGTLIESSRANDEPLTFAVGDPRMPRGLSIGARLLTVGGRVKLTVPPERAYGQAGVPGRIPANSTMVYDIELLDYTYRPKEPPFIPGDPAKTRSTASGLQYQVLTAAPAEASSPAASDIVEIEYAIWTMEGRPMGGTYQMGTTAKAPINGLSHPFLRECLPMMKPGAEWRMVVPAALTVEQIENDTVWQVKLVSYLPSPVMPRGDDEKSTSTKSGLYYQRLVEGRGTRPGKDYTCELEWAFWKEDGSFVAGDVLQGRMKVQVRDGAAHKFLPEILQKMQIGEVMRVEVPSEMTVPRMIPFKTIWQLKIIDLKRPLPAPEFVLPPDEELTTTRSGLKYKVLEQGDEKGPTPNLRQKVTVHYVGWLKDGTQFDSSYARSEPTTFGVDQVIRGWSEGLQLMKPGTTVLMVIPSNLAYGAQGTPDGTIPPDATLVFHVKLLEIK